MTVNWAESKWSGQVRKGPVRMVSHFPTQHYSKPSVLQTKNSNCSGQSLVVFWLSPRLLCGQFLLFCHFPVWQNGDNSLFMVKRQNSTAFSSLISQVQRSSLWAGHYIWRKKERPVATERSSRRCFQRLTTGQRLRNTAVFQLPCSHSVMLLGRHTESWLYVTSKCFNILFYTFL